MLESYETIQEVLLVAGETLEFDYAYVLGIPFFDTRILYSTEVTFYKIENQDFKFHLSTRDCLENNISNGNEFFMNTDDFIYKFKLRSNPVDMFDGWSRIDVDYISREEV